MPYATKLLEQELSTYMNIGMRILTNNDLQKLEAPELRELSDAEQFAALSAVIPTRILPDTTVPEFVALTEEQVANLEDLSALSAIAPPPPMEMEVPAVVPGVEGDGLEEFDTESIPLEPVAPAAPAPAQQQPYIVIPMNSAQAQAFAPPTGQEAAPPQQAAPQQMALVASIAPPASILPPPIPGAPPMISVDTSAAALQAQGLPAVQQPIRSALRSNAGRNTTRRVGFAQQQQAAPQAPSPAANVRINVIKRE